MFLKENAVCASRRKKHNFKIVYKETVFDTANSSPNKIFSIQECINTKLNTGLSPYIIEHRYAFACQLACVPNKHYVKTGVISTCVGRVLCTVQCPWTRDHTTLHVIIYSWYRRIYLNYIHQF
jgi:hypothetical protein